MNDYADQKTFLSRWQQLPPDCCTPTSSEIDGGDTPFARNPTKEQEYEPLLLIPAGLIILIVGYFFCEAM